MIADRACSHKKGGRYDKGARNVLEADLSTRFTENEYHTDRASLGTKLEKAVSAAIAEAELASHRRERHGACVLRNRLVIGRGHNSSRPLGYIRTSRIRQFCNEESHAETAAMHKVPRPRLRGSVVVVVRLARSGELTYSRPCGSCMETMYRKGIRKCYYSIQGDTFGVIAFPRRTR